MIYYFWCTKLKSIATTTHSEQVVYLLDREHIFISIEQRKIAQNTLALLSRSVGYLSQSENNFVSKINQQFNTIYINW